MDGNGYLLKYRNLFVDLYAAITMIIHSSFFAGQIQFCWSNPHMFDLYICLNPKKIMILRDLNNFFGPSMSNSELFILEKKNDVEKIFRETHKGRRLNEQVESHLQAPQPAVLGSL